MKIVNLVELLRNIIWFLNWLFSMVKIVYRVWRKNMLVCNGFIIGGINELVILVYSSNKFVIVFFRFLYKNIIV